MCRAWFDFGLTEEDAQKRGFDALQPETKTAALDAMRAALRALAEHITDRMIQAAFDGQGDKRQGYYAIRDALLAAASEEA
jgi:hypothetical protein